jgi:acetyl esterase/lipase
VFADLSGLPELFMFASQHEILRSDATRLDENARKHGVTSTLTLRPKMPHVWPIMVTLPEAKADLRLAAQFAIRVTSAGQSPAA